MKVFLKFSLRTINFNHFLCYFSRRQIDGSFLNFPKKGFGIYAKETFSGKQEGHDGSISLTWIMLYTALLT